MKRSDNLLLERLRSALSDTALDEPRPMTSLEVPMGMDRRIVPRMRHRLKLAAVLVAIVERPSGPQVIFTERSGELRAHSGQISFPGGRCDEDDADVVATALREAHEEIGLSPKLPKVIGFLDDYPTVTGYLVTPVVAVVPDLVKLVANPQEVAEIFEVPLSFVLDRNNLKRPRRWRWGMPVPYYELFWQEWRIWGATAGMLKNMGDLLSEPS